MAKTQRSHRRKKHSGGGLLGMMGFDKKQNVLTPTQMGGKRKRRTSKRKSRKSRKSRK